MTSTDRSDGVAPSPALPRRSRVALAAYGALVAAPLLFLFGRAVLSGDASRPAPSAPALAAAPAAEPPAEPPVRAYPAAEAPPFPDVAAFSLPGGHRSRLIDAVSRPALFHFFSLSCRSCAREWPELRDLLLRGSGLPPIVPVLVHPDDDEDWLAGAVAEVERIRADGWFGVPAEEFRVGRVVGESAVLSPSGRPEADRPLTGYPETLLVDREGRVRLHVVGPVGWSPATWERMLAEAEAAR